MDGFVELLWLLVQYYWYIFPIIAVVLFFFIQQYSRTIINVVEYHRRGGTRSTHRCRIDGTNIYFKPNPKSKFQHVVPVTSEPETEVRGNTIRRVYHVVEGAGETFAFRHNVDTIVKEVYDYMETLLKGEHSELSHDTILTTKLEIGKLKEAILPMNAGIPKPSETSPTTMAASTSMNLFQAWCAHLATHLPKTKGEWLTMFMYIILGFGAGIAYGMLVAKMGWLG